MMHKCCEVQYISFHKMQQACKDRESISWQVRIATMLRTDMYVHTYVCMHLKDLSQLEATAGYPGCLGVHFVDIRKLQCLLCDNDYTASNDICYPLHSRSGRPSNAPCILILA